MNKQMISFLALNTLLVSFGTIEYIKEYSPNTSSRPGWIKGQDNKLPYVNEIQVHLGRGDEKKILERSKDIIQGTTSHFTVLTNGEVFRHAQLEQIAHFFPKHDKKLRLQDQYLIHIDVAGREPNSKQINALYKIIDEITVLMPNICTKWCVTEPYLLTVPWIKERPAFQYSDNLYLYKLFSLTNQSSDISTVNNAPIYWVSSMHSLSRGNNIPETLNIFRTGISDEETLISYINRSKKVSSHFTIDDNGRIFQHLSLDKASYFVTPSYGPLSVGKNSSLNQITIGLAGSLKYPITLAQKESLLDLAKSLKQKYSLKNWTTPCIPTKDTAKLEKNLIPFLERLDEVHLTQDPQLKDAQSLIYHYSSPNQSDRPAGKTIDTIVLHHTHSSWPATLLGFSTDPGISSHFTVNKDGTIVQHVPIERKAWHAGVSKDKRGFENVNEFSIGIEIVNYGDCKDPYTDEQITALIGLLRDLKNLLGENLVQITSHEYIAQPKGRKNDPLGLPWEKLSEFNKYIVRNKDEQILGQEYAD